MIRISKRVRWLAVSAALLGTLSWVSMIFPLPPPLPSLKPKVSDTVLTLWVGASYYVMFAPGAIMALISCASGLAVIIPKGHWQGSGFVARCCAVSGIVSADLFLFVFIGRPALGLWEWWEVIAYVLLFSIAGTVVSLAALLPVRGLAQRGVTVRRATIFALALISFVVTFVLYQGNTARLHYNLTCPGFDDTSMRLCRGIHDDETVIISELWIRQVLPYPLRQQCYTGNSKACLWGDFVIRKYAYGIEEKYLLTIILSLISPLVTGTTAWHLTRQPKQRESP